MTSTESVDDLYNHELQYQRNLPTIKVSMQWFMHYRFTLQLLERILLSHLSKRTHVSLSVCQRWEKAWKRG